MSIIDDIWEKHLEAIGQRRTGDPRIQEQSDEILKSLLGGYIYGVPITEESSMAEIIVAAYYLGAMRSNGLDSPYRHEG